MALPAPTLNDPETVARLCAEYLGLARHYARQFARGWPSESHEFESAALFALWETARTFDPARGPFGVQAAVRIRCGLCTAWRRAKVRSRVKLLEPRRLDLPVDPPEPPLDHGEAFEAMLDVLPPRQRELLRAIFRDGLPDGAAGKRVGLSKSRTSRVLYEALDTLREHLRTRP